MKKISIAVEAGYQLYQFPNKRIDINGTNYFSGFSTNSDTSFVSPSGYKANIEGRYYIITKNHSRLAVSLYAAINFFYRRNKTDMSIYYEKDSTTPAIDCYWLKRRNYGVLQVIGLQFVHKRLIIEGYTGIGVMDRLVNNYNREYTKGKDQLFTNRHGFGSERKYLAEYSEGTIAFSGGFRIGWRLN